MVQHSDNDTVHAHAMRIAGDTESAYQTAYETGFALLDTPIDEMRLKNRLNDAQCGAFASFEGWVRNHNNDTSVERLTYYGYEALALNQGRDIIARAKQRFDIVDAIAVHRIGALAVGDMAVWIGVVSAHRYPAFDACRWILDTIKADIPVWKQEYYTDNHSEWLSNNG